MKSAIFAVLALTMTTVAHAAPATPADIAFAKKAGMCKMIFNGPGDRLQIAWRSTYTNSNQSGGVSATNPAREKEILGKIDYLLEGILDEDATGEMSIIPEAGVTKSILRPSGDYGSHVTEIMGVSGLGPSGILRATIVVPVSGHLGEKLAREWAAKDTYAIEVRSKTPIQSQLVKTDAPFIDRATGAKSGYPSQALIHGALSQGLVTLQEVEIPLIPNQPVTVMYNRQGSAGPAGYPEGRIIDIVWDGK